MGKWRKTTSLPRQWMWNCQHNMKYWPSCLGNRDVFPPLSLRSEGKGKLCLPSVPCCQIWVVETRPHSFHCMIPNWQRWHNDTWAADFVYYLYATSLSSDPRLLTILNNCLKHSTHNTKRKGYRKGRRGKASLQVKTSKIIYETNDPHHHQTVAARDSSCRRGVRSWSQDPSPNIARKGKR